MYGEEIFLENRGLWRVAIYRFQIGELPPGAMSVWVQICSRKIPGTGPTAGDNLEEAAHMAAEAASLHVYSMEYDHEEIPTPSVNLSKEDTEGNVVMPVTIHPDLFRMKKDNERIKTNITLPAWLKRIAEEQKVNYSRLLETALIDYLQIPMSGRQ